MRKNYFRLACLLCGMVFICGCADKKKETAEEVIVEDSTEQVLANAMNFKPEDYVKLGDYKKLNVQYPLPMVSDEDLEMYVSDLLSEQTEYLSVERAVQNGDFINIDYKGMMNGEEFEGGSDEGYEFVLGEGEFLEEFENAILGKKAGESTTFEMTFPEDYYEDMAGKTVEFTITINSVSEVKTPEYTDAFVKEVTDYDTITTYEESLREELFVTAQEDSMSEAAINALNIAIENAEIDGYPQDLYDYCYEETINTYEMYAEMFGITLEEFMTDYMGDSDMDEVVLPRVNEIMVQFAIAEKEDLMPDKNFEEEAENLAYSYGYDTLEDFRVDYNDTEIRLYIIEEKVQAFLYENAELEEVSSDEYYSEDEFVEEGTETVLEDFQEDTE